MKSGPGRKPKNGVEALTRVRRIRLSDAQARVFDDAGPDAVRGLLDALERARRSLPTERIVPQF